MSSALPNETLRIPNIIHFVFGLSDDPADRQLFLFHFLAVKSAAMVNRPDRILFHYGYEPVGEWWEQIKQLVEPRVVEVPQHIHGKPLMHFAHKSDVLRLQVLQEFGGIYLDLDTISVRSLAPLRKHGFVIGKQTVIFPWNWKQRLKKCLLEGTGRYLRRPIEGLCNAVLLSEPNSPFMNTWLDSYKNFRSRGRDEYWCEHSVKLPLQLAGEHPRWVHIASEWAFHYPLFDDAGLKDLFVHTKQFPKAYVHHLWNSSSRESYLNALTIETIKAQDTTYNVIARRYL